MSNRIQTLLSGKGYQANSFKVSAEALQELETSKKAPYTLIISSYMMPKMKGDEILKKAKKTDPDTQRMLLADSADLQTLDSAINEAGIHSCLTLPFEDKDFLIHVNHCCDQYEINKNQKNLKKITQRQNKQLFQIAGNFKKKEALYVEQSAKKKKEIRILESRVRATGRSAYPDKPALLQDILAKRNVSFSPDNFGHEFLKISDQIKQIIETTVSSQYITLQPISYQKAFAQTLSENEYRPFVGKILPLVYTMLKKNNVPDAEPSKEVKAVILDDHFELTLSKNKTRALIKIKTIDNHILNLAYIKQFLEKNKIINGLIQDHEIDTWLHKTTPEDEPFMIARAKEPKYPKDARIRYHFPADFLHAGKVNKDGSINFQDRGEIPYVEENAFLAAKIFPEGGAPGIDVLGKEIAVGDPVDLTFSSGPGTRISEDGVRIYAATAGQPHLDAMGNISVCPEFQIKGDLGFETGDVNFDGNVIVNGTVKQGFKVKCASLTAKEIQGAQIDIEGDLNVSLGIVDTELVKVKGSVQAKFVHNSKINAFGDLIVQKEIIDSKINLSGACINDNGSIINSKISAKTGISAGSIGNKSSKPSTLTVGVDEHANLLVARVDSKLNINNTACNELTTEVKELEKEDQDLHALISKQAYIQDRGQLELKDIEKKMENLKASGNMAAFQKVSKTITEIQENTRKAEEEINKGFNRQDGINLEISQKKGRVNEFEDQNKKLLDEKKRLLEFSDKNEPLPEVKVAKKIESGTKIFAANSSLNLYKSSSRCRIKELSRSPDGGGGIEFYEMKISDY
ncbi:MAG: FapA family protein [Desulfobacula sp.]|nr:FapA family protein [Desulfobacula sp.]